MQFLKSVAKLIAFKLLNYFCFVTVRCNSVYYISSLNNYQTCLLSGYWLFYRNIFQNIICNVSTSIMKLYHSRPTAITESLARFSLQSGVLGLDTVTQGSCPPGTRWGNGSQGPLARKQKRQRCRALKTTQHGLVKRSYGNLSSFPSVSLFISHIR